MKKPSLLILWSIYIVIVLVSGAVVLYRGVNIETDFLKIFPKYQERGSFYVANANYEDHFENELLVFFVGKDKDRLISEVEDHFQKGSEVFSSVQWKFDGAVQEELAQYLYSNRNKLLTQDQIERAQSGQTNEIFNTALSSLYSPVGFTSQVRSDPLGLFRDYFLKISGNFAVKPDNGYMIAEQNDDIGIFARINLNKDSFTFNEQLIEYYETSKASLAQKNINFYAYGASLFSAFGSTKSMDEANFYGTFSFIAVLALLIWSFLSLVPVAISMLTIVVSVAAGIIAVLFVYSSFHILSVLLGISVLGIVTDYCTHFFSKSYDRNVKSSQDAITKIKSALGIGFLTNLLIYLCFYFTDLVVLKQLSIFTIAGIFTTYLTVLAFFPILPLKPLNPGRFSWVTRLRYSTNRVVKSSILIGTVLVIGVGYLISGGFNFNDDVRLLQNVDATLKSDEVKVFSLLGGNRPSSYFIVRAETPEELLQKEELLSSQLEGVGDVTTLSISNYVPSAKKQIESIAAYKKLEPTMMKFLRGIDYEGEFNLKLSSEPLKLGDFLKRATNLPISSNWLGKVDNYYYSVMNILGASDVAVFKNFENNDIQFVDKASDLTSVMKSLRETVIKQFLWVFILLLIVLLCVFKLKAFTVLFPPTAAACFTLVISMFIFNHLNLFNILATILIFCLGMDYSVFYAQSKNSSLPTLIGIFISFISTISAFGILAFSSTHAVSSFGLSVFLGICVCYFLSPLALGDQHE